VFAEQRPTPAKRQHRLHPGTVLSNTLPKRPQGAFSGSLNPLAKRQAVPIDAPSPQITGNQGRLREGTLEIRILKGIAVAWLVFAENARPTQQLEELTAEEDGNVPRSAMLLGELIDPFDVGSSQAHPKHVLLLRLLVVVRGVGHDRIEACTPEEGVGTAETLQKEAQGLDVIVQLRKNGRNRNVHTSIAHGLLCGAYYHSREAMGHFGAWIAGAPSHPRGDGSAHNAERRKGGLPCAAGVQVAPASAGPNSSASPPIPSLAGVSPRWARRRSAETIGVRVAATAAESGEHRGGSRGAQPEDAAVQPTAAAKPTAGASCQHHTWGWHGGSRRFRGSRGGERTFAQHWAKRNGPLMTRPFQSSESRRRGGDSGKNEIRKGNFDRGGDRDLALGQSAVLVASTFSVFPSVEEYTE